MYSNYICATMRTQLRDSNEFEGRSFRFTFTPPIAVWKRQPADRKIDCVQHTFTCFTHSYNFPSVAPLQRHVWAILMEIFLSLGPAVCEPDMFLADTVNNL